MFSWKEIHEETANRILTLRNRQDEMIAIIASMQAAGLTSISIKDQDPKETWIPLGEIDPFTFLANFNRSITWENRIALWDHLKKAWNLKAPVPEDFDGIPVANNQNSWLMSFKYLREDDHVPLLWDFFEHIMQTPWESLDIELMAHCLEKRKVGPVNLTMGMFWARPDSWISADSVNVDFANNKGIETDPTKDPASYLKWLHEVRESHGGDLLGFSREAYIFAESKRAESKATPALNEPGEAYNEGIKYWLIAPGEGARLMDDCIAESVIRLGWDGTPDLREFKTKDAIVDFLAKEFPQWGPAKVAFMLWNFANVVKNGDIVFAKKGNNIVCGWGIVEGDYEYDPAKGEYRHVRKIEWKSTDSVTMPDSIKLPNKTLTPKSRDQEFLQFVSRQYDGIPGIASARNVPLGVARNYWWLNANPHIWDIEGTPIGEIQTYTSRNEKGNKRQKYKYLEAVEPGDLMIGYVTSPKRRVAAICQITKGLHETANGEGIAFQKIRTIDPPIAWEMLHETPGLEQCEPLRSNQGSLFSLTENEFRVIDEFVDSEIEVGTDDVGQYSREIALTELFVSDSKFDGILKLLERKKNIILQGAPGTGKTFMARRLAYVLMGAKDAVRAPMVQFHQSYAYEDFVQGYRPDGNGFSLKNGVFYQFCRKAQAKSDVPHVLIIDEINRGNLSKIFGELMLLIEPDKRGEDFALQLTYTRNPEETFYVPDNLHIIGTMNTADRSLSMVDYALRRRFAFVDLDPEFDSSKYRALLATRGATSDLINRICSKMGALNQTILDDSRNLGRGYRIGHSFFCPDENTTADDEWYADVVQNEIAPLLYEYWMDDLERAQAEIENLLA